MEVSTAISRCAHMIHNSDDVDSLQEILLELSSACIYAFPSTFLPKGDRTFLMASAKHGRYKCCKLILSLDSAATINLQNSQGYTALHYAAYGGNTEIAFLLLAAGAKVDIRNIHGETAYETAVSGKKMELLRRFQASQYYDALVNGANNPQGPYLTDNVAQELTENDASTTYHGAITRRDALMHHMEITAVDVGAESTLVGQSFHCLSSEQQRENVEHLNKFSGATCAAFGSIGYYPSEDLYIGRARSNHVCISDLSLSKQHAVISYYENVGFLVYDMGSKHGTFIDGERIIAQAEVKPVDNLISSDRKKDTADSDKCGDVAEDTAGVLQSATPAPTPVPTPATQYLKEGMEVRFGRIHCKVVRKRQDAVISSGFQPGSGAVISAPSTVSKHHSAVEQRVRVLLNVPEGVKISTSGNPEAKQKDEQQRVEPKKSAGVKRKAFEQPAPLPPSLPDNQSIACKTSSDPVLQPDYKGLRLLQKFGWQGEALGKSGGTANAPIEVYKISDRAGLGSEAHQKACQKPAVQSCSSDLSRGATGQVAPTIDEKLDSEKTKAWKRMMLRFNEPR